MSEMITISTEKTRATIDPMGAYLTTLRRVRRDLIYPRITNEASKIRGGMPICAPWFGPRPNMPQHGFGRDVLWSVEPPYNPGPADSVELVHNQTEDMYKGLESRVNIKIIDGINEHGWDTAELKASLQLTNNGNAGVLVAPGFHPYFNGEVMLEDLSSIETGAEAIEGRFSELYISEAQDRQYRYIFAAGGLLVQMTTDLPVGVSWTDSNEYGCVEPTYNGAAFKDGEEEARSKAANLEPGESLRFNLSLVWEINRSKKQ